jgi:uncharacterized cupredoxin-like copper-binding protein
MRIINTFKTLSIGAIAVVFAAGCASTAVQAPAAAQAPVAAVNTPGGTVNTTLTDMKITVDHAAMSAGAITFVVKNTGAVAHELVLLRTDVAQDKLATDPDEAGKMDETGNIGETGDMAVGESKSFTVTLAAGHYVLMCNEIGHYSAGMHMTFTVN